MNELLMRLARGSRAVWLLTALAAAVTAASAQPLPVAARTAPAAAPDPIGALLAKQGLGNGPRALPMVIGLKIGESAGRSRFTMELSDPLDVRVFTLTSPNRVVFDMPEVLWRVAGRKPPPSRGAVEEPCGCACL